MIGDDPYTLGLFDTAGMSIGPANITTTARPDAASASFTISRSGGLRSIATALVPPDRRLPRLLFRDIACVFRERQGEVVPRGSPPLPWCALLDCRNSGRSKRRPGRHREALETEAEAPYNGTRREAR